MMIGSERSASVKTPDTKLTPRPRKMQKNVRPKSPKMIDGTPAKLAIDSRIKVVPQPEESLYSTK